MMNAADKGSWYRRVVAAGVVAALAATGFVVSGGQAVADQAPTVQITVVDNPSTVVPGDSVTVVETVTNPNPFSILQPTANLFSTPDAITGYTTLTGCDAGPGGSCTTTSDGSGYEAIFGAAISGFSSATATFTLQINPSDVTTATETLEGELVATNFVSDVVAGDTLTVNAQADLAVAMTGTPKYGLLSLTLNFTVTVTNNGPATLRNATITAAVPLGLSVKSSSTCTATKSGATCAIGSLPSGGKATATFGVPIGLLDIGIPFQFSASRTASVPMDPNPANDSASVSCTAVSVLLASCATTQAGVKHLPLIGRN